MQGAVDSIYILSLMGIAVIFIVFMVRMFQLTLNRIISIKKVLLLCIISLAATITIMFVPDAIVPGEVNGVYNWSIGPLVAGSIAFVEEVFILIIISISALVRRVRHKKAVY